MSLAIQSAISFNVSKLASAPATTLATSATAAALAALATEPAVSASPSRTANELSCSATYTCNSANAPEVAIPSVFLFTYSTTVAAVVPSGRTPTNVSKASTSF